MTSVRRGMTASVVGVSMLLLAGCARRSIVVTTEPPGALLWVNDRELGRTPVEFEFADYGTYDVRLELDGYEPVMTFGDADPPIWDLPGPDLIFELIPGAAVRKQWHYVLEVADDRPEPLLERARSFRATAGDETR